MTLTLSVVETLSGDKVIAVSAAEHKAKKRKRTVVLGTSTVKIPAGQKQIVSVALNATGKRILSRRHSLAVKLTAAQRAGTSSTVTGRFTVPVKKNKRR